MSKKQREVGRAERAAAVRQATGRPTSDDRRVLITVAVLVVLAVIVTVGVLLGGSKEQPVEPPATRRWRPAADGQALVAGHATRRRTKVVVYEDFLCPYCREFESASRATLRAAAARGDAIVEYRPFHLLQDDYSTRALTAWAAVLEHGTPEQALKFHDLLYENQPYEADADKPGVEDLVALAKKAGVTDPEVLERDRPSPTSRSSTPRPRLRPRQASRGPRPC